MNGIKEERMSNTTEYKLTFQTTSYDEYKKVRDFCQKLIYERKNNNLCDTNPFGDDKFGGLRMTNDRNKMIVDDIRKIIKKYDDMNLTVSFEERRENHIKTYMEIKDYFNNCEE